MRKLKVNQIKELKKKFKEEKNENSVSLSSQIRNVKQIVREEKALSGVNLNEERKKQKEIRRTIKEELASSEKITKSYSFKEGDLVSFVYNGKREEGIILSLVIYNNKKNRNNKQKAYGTVVMMSSIGRVIICPTKIVEIFT